MNAIPSIHQFKIAKRVCDEMPHYEETAAMRRGYIDARPVIWSLRYQPGDWRYVNGMRFLHMPSDHTFQAGLFQGGVYEATCDCTGNGLQRHGAFTLRDNVRFYNAARIFLESYWYPYQHILKQEQLAEKRRIDAQFRKHFTHPVPEKQRHHVRDIRHFGDSRMMP